LQKRGQVLSNGTKGKDGIFGKFKPHCIRNIIRFVTVETLLVSWLKKRNNDKYVSCQYIIYVNYKYTKADWLRNIFN
jgi:hypothetical protein